MTREGTASRVMVLATVSALFVLVWATVAAVPALHRTTSTPPAARLCDSPATPVPPRDAHTARMEEWLRSVACPQPEPTAVQTVQEIPGEEPEPPALEAQLDAALERALRGFDWTLTYVEPADYDRAVAEHHALPDSYAMTICAGRRCEVLIPKGRSPWRATTERHEKLHVVDWIDNGKFDGSADPTDCTLRPADCAHSWVYWALQNPDAAAVRIGQLADRIQAAQP